MNSLTVYPSPNIQNCTIRGVEKCTDSTWVGRTDSFLAHPFQFTPECLPRTQVRSSGFESDSRRLGTRQPECYNWIRIPRNEARDAWLQLSYPAVLIVNDVNTYGTCVFYFRDCLTAKEIAVKWNPFLMATCNDNFFPEKVPSHSFSYYNNVFNRKTHLVRP